MRLDAAIVRAFSAVYLFNFVMLSLRLVDWISPGVQWTSATEWWWLLMAACYLGQVIAAFLLVSGRACPPAFAVMWGCFFAVTWCALTAWHYQTQALLESGLYMCFFRRGKDNRWVVFLMWAFVARVLFEAGISKIFSTGTEEWLKLRATKGFALRATPPNYISWHFSRLPDWAHVIFSGGTLLIECLAPAFIFLSKHSRRVGAVGIMLMLIGVDMVGSIGPFPWTLIAAAIFLFKNIDLSMMFRPRRAQIILAVLLLVVALDAVLCTDRVGNDAAVRRVRGYLPSFIFGIYHPFSNLREKPFAVDYDIQYKSRGWVSIIDIPDSVGHYNPFAYHRYTETRNFRMVGAFNPVTQTSTIKTLGDLARNMPGQKRIVIRTLELSRNQPMLISEQVGIIPVKYDRFGRVLLLAAGRDLQALGFSGEAAGVMRQVFGKNEVAEASAKGICAGTFGEVRAALEEGDEWFLKKILPLLPEGCWMVYNPVEIQQLKNIACVVMAAELQPQDAFTACTEATIYDPTPSTIPYLVYTRMVRAIFLQRAGKWNAAEEELARAKELAGQDEMLWELFIRTNSGINLSRYVHRLMGQL